jgi:Tetratricopeptide repeat
VWWVLVLAGLAGAGLASVWLFVIFKKQSDEPSSAAFLAVAGFVAAATQVVLAGLQLRQGSRAVPTEPLAPPERREGQASDRLRQHLGRQARLRRMDETSALALRVHPAIGLVQPPQRTAAIGAETDNRPGRLRRRFPPRPGRERPRDVQTLDRDLPTFVGRDRGPEITSWMRRARDNGGFLVVVGNSSVGKTRLLYETARDVLPDFVVLAPDLGNGDLVNSIAKAATFPLPPKLIVWLDELQRFLDGPYLTPGSIPITAAAVRHLLLVRERVSGPEHPDTLATRANLARWTGEAGDAGAARDQFAALVSVRERVLGPEHPRTVTTRRQLAYWTEWAERPTGHA